MADAQIIWFRQDLRLADQAAVRSAANAGPVVAVYVLDDETPGEWRTGGAQRWWLHHSLTSLASDLQRQGVALILRRGRPEVVLTEIAAALSTRSVHALHHYEPFAKAQEAAVTERLDLQLHDGNLLLRPGAVVNGSGARFKIFTPFWKAAQAQLPPAAPLAAPEITAAVHDLASDSLAGWHLLPTKPDWSGGFNVWKPGEAGAQAQLQTFAHVAHDYATGRNIPGEALTSRLSPFLHFGEISPRAVWAAISAAAGDAAEPFLRELGWRDFAQTLIDSFPQ